LPDKCVRGLLGRAVIEYTFDHALASKLLSAIVFSTDSAPAKAVALARGIEVIDRPAELATDTATVDAVARHAVEEWERRGAEKTPLGPPLVRGEARRIDVVVLLYGNIPVRAEGLIDRAIEHLQRTGADSVRSVAPVTKQHPDWVHRLDGDRMVQFRANSIYRRQDLEPLYYHDGAVAVVTRAALFGALAMPEDHQSFLGRDRRAIVCHPEDAVDIDGPVDLCLAEAILRNRATKPRRHEATKENAIQISDFRVGLGERVFVIAEAGVNHDGDVETALRMVDAAAAAGADAVKFQMFRAADLATATAPMAAYQRAATAAYQRAATKQTSQREMLSRLELSVEEFARIKRRCDERGILFLATPFGRAEVEQLVAMGAPAIKIASTDLTNVELLDAAAATGLPLIVSTGASTCEEIEESVKHLAPYGAADRLVLLHCVSRYPAPIGSINLRVIRTLREAFGVPAGLSDHTTSTRTGALAVAAGACVLEKHFTLDRGAAGPDHAMSLSADELAAYIAAVREAESSLGDGVIGMNEGEHEVREAARRSVVASVAIAKGTRIARSMLTIKRPGTGIPGARIEEVAGRVAATDIPSDTVLAWDMVQ
jgi:N-acetylneuraminate synthase/N,N'-diacetyllegionaminate synthase